jgi:REP element-mobilizing transposase RayT
MRAAFDGVKYVCRNGETIIVDRFWLLTWTTYGTWLPGDRRGFVSPVRQDDGTHVIYNVPGTPVDSDMPNLERAMRQSMKGKTIRLTQEQATVVVGQFHETVAFRGWQLQAAAVMASHVHLVVGVDGDPDLERILHSVKSYASRAHNKQWERPRNGTWLPPPGSKRKLPDERAVIGAVRYVLDQEYPLVVGRRRNRGHDWPRSPRFAPFAIMHHRRAAGVNPLVLRIPRTTTCKSPK